MRDGAADGLAALDVQAGTVIREVHRRHRSTEFRHFLDTVERTMPAELALRLILDNASSHKTPLVRRWLLRYPRLHLHFTSTSASWLNLEEYWFSILQRRELARGAFRSTQALEKVRRVYVATNSENPEPSIWRKSVDDSLASVERDWQQTNDSHR